MKIKSFWKKREKEENSEQDSTSEKQSGFQIPTLEITPEREKEIIDKVTEKILQYRLEAPALLFLIPFQPISLIASQLTVLPFAPLLEAFEIPGYDYVAFLKKSENLKRIIKNIEEATSKKEKSKGWLSGLFKKRKKEEKMETGE